MMSFAACGSSGSGSGRSQAQAGSVTIAFDTRAGGEELVQLQLAGVTLEGPSGIQTANLLDEVVPVVLADGAGEVSGVQLRPAPTQRYVAVHLVVVPQSGVALDAAGGVRPIQVPLEIVAPIETGLQHRADRSSWLVIGHDKPPVEADGTGALVFDPRMSARPDGEELALEGLAFPVVRGGVLTATATTVDDAVVEIEPQVGCFFVDSEGNVYQDWNSFLAAIQGSDTIDVRGYVTDADFEAYRICRCTHGSESRLIGRVQSADPNTASFVLRVQAVNRRSTGLELVTPEDVEVLTQGSRLERPNGNEIPFGELQPGELAKVRWSSRLIQANTITRYEASNVQVPGPGGVALPPRWRGEIQSVDPVNGVFVVRPHNGAVLSTHGTLLQQLEVRVTPSTSIVRVQQGGPATIGVAELLAGTDRCWIRGTAIEPGVVEATTIRVRAQ